MQRPAIPSHLKTRTGPGSVAGIRLWEAARIPLCMQTVYHASEALGPFVWAAILRAREIAAGTFADAVVQTVAARAGLD